MPPCNSIVGLYLKVAFDIISVKLFRQYLVELNIFNGLQKIPLDNFPINFNI